MTRIVPTSVTRRANFEEVEPEVAVVPREEWSTGDFVVAEVLASGTVPYRIETPTGRMAEVAPGDRIVGALGRRAATLEIVGDWHEMSDDHVLQVLIPGGVLGRCVSAAIPPLPMADVRYVGHAVLGNETQTMSGSVDDIPSRNLRAPVVLIIGTSMDTGKTVAGKAIVRQLKRMGARVAAVKVTGVARYRDVLAFRDAGADFVADFVDAGLPSTVVPPQDFRYSLQALCSMVAADEPDVVVVEAGASPLEPYNGDQAVAALSQQVRFTILCASDPYAVVGVMSAFKLTPDLISGRATSTTAGIELIEKLVDVPALNLLDGSGAEPLGELLAGALSLADA